MSGLVLEHNQGYAIDVAASSSRTFPEQFQYVFTFRDSRGKQVSGPPTRIPRINVDVTPSGSYSQEIRAYNVDLVESEPVVVAITIKRAPFPWTSTALSILLMLALVALAWGWLQNKRLIRSNVALAETRMQLANETETERRRIARDLHDQTLSDPKSDESCTRLIRSLDSLPSQLIPHAIVRLAFESCENKFLSPVWWDGLDTESRVALEQRYFLPTNLQDDGLRAVSWEVISKECNLI